MINLSHIQSTTCCILVFVAGYSSDIAAEDLFSKVVQPAFQNCTKCHGGGWGGIKGDVNLFAIKSEKDLLKDLDLLSDIIDAVDSGEMPPEDEPQLAKIQRKEIVDSLKTLLRKGIHSQKAFPHTPIRRMNRFQYNNAVQDLFKLKVEVFSLPERMLREYGYFNPASGKMPQELKAGSRPLGKSQLIERRLAGVAPFPQDLRAEHGFDNRADHLSLSPLLLESFLKLSRSIVESPDFGEKTCGIWKQFFAPPSDSEKVEEVVRGRLNPFLDRAFRHQVSDQLLDRYTKYAMNRIRAGASFTDAMKSVASATLASPRFLYLYERATPAGKLQKLDDFELASRLSFFLWGSIPDESLLEIAAQGKLSDPTVLELQVERMLNDIKLKRFCDSFPAQWLQLERIISSVPDPEEFPEFYFAKFRVSMHMMLEPLLLFETVVVEDRSILELVDSNFSYRSDMLEAWYKDGTKGNRVPPVAIPFRRVKISDRRQGGVITNAAVMTMTSGVNETKPITRGAWLATVIFNDAPKPPPADVPPLPEDSRETADMTLRERFEVHRTRQDCAGCHKQLDPLGFALENFDPVGVWRDNYENGREIDSSGKLFNQHEFTNVVEFKDAILKEKTRFARAFVSHLLSYALGRELTAFDAPTVEKIAERAAQNDFRFRSLVKAIILSEPFQHKSKPLNPASK